MARPRPQNLFWFEPYLPKNSIVLLYGRSGIGKTAVAWQMAQAIQLGEPIWGFPTEQGNVLFLELDMPEIMAVERWAGADPPFLPAFDIGFDECSLDHQQFLRPFKDERHKEIEETLKTWHKERGYGVVFVDALRETFTGDLNVSGNARRIYDAFKTLFPGATIVFIHHQKKSGNPQYSGDPLESASGSMEFINVAQVALQFHRKARGETWLEHLKTQASAEFEPLPISLGSDGVHVVHRYQERLTRADKIVADYPRMQKRDLDRLIAKQLGMSDKSARMVRLAVEQRRKQDGTDRRADAVEGPVVGGSGHRQLGEDTVVTQEENLRHREARDSY
jgi:RecA-family ATPase